MPIILPVEGMRLMLESVLDAAPLVLRLFTNDITPGLLDMAANYEECTAPGYEPHHMERDAWSFRSPGEIASTLQTFTFMERAEVVGCYLTQEDSGRLFWAQRAEEAPLRFEIPGDQLMMAPTVTLGVAALAAGSWVETPDGIGVVAAVPGTLMNPVGVALGAEPPRLSEAWVVHLVGPDGRNRQRAEPYEAESVTPDGAPQTVTLRRLVTEGRRYDIGQLALAAPEAIPESRRGVV